MKRIVIILAIGLTQCKPPLQPKPNTYVKYECQCELGSVEYEFLEDSEAIEEEEIYCESNGCKWVELE